MITNPSQWQIDMSSKHDQIVITKKTFVMRLLDFITRHEPEYVVVRKENSKGKIEETIADKRLVFILSKEELNSKVSSDVKYSKLSKEGNSFDSLRDGKIVTSVNDLIVFVDNSAYSFPLSVVESCIEKSKRKYNMIAGSFDESFLDYETIKIINLPEFDYRNFHYKFKNGFLLEFILCRRSDKADKNKDKFRILENFFKISVSGNDASELEDKMYKLISDKINILMTESEDKVYESTLLFNSYTEIISECVEVTEIKNKGE